MVQVLKNGRTDKLAQELARERASLRILVDGSELADGSHKPSFWQTTLPFLVGELKPAKLFLLNRPAPHVSFPLVTAHILNAPPVDYTDSRMEDRRLAALCEELDIDLFISTGYTSAGGSIASSFVATDSMKDQFHLNPDLRNAGVRSSHLASVHISTSESSAQQLRELSELDMRYVRRSTDPHSLATILVDSLHSDTPDAVRMIREREEQKIRLEVERLHDKEQLEAQKQWQIAIDNFGKLPLIPHIWRAVRNVRRYPEYVRRVLRLGSRPGGAAF